MSKISSIAAFIFAMVILSSSVGCGMVVINYDKFGDGGSGTDTLNSATSDNADTSSKYEAVENDFSEKISEYLGSLPEENYGGTSFQIVSPDTSSLGEEGYEFLSEAAAARNRTVSEKYSVDLVITKVEYTSLFDEVSTAVKSGMYYSDLLMLPQESVGSFSASGLLMNLRSLPGLDFDAEFFNESSIEAGAGGFSSYAVAGPACLYPYSLPAVFFNKQLCSDIGSDPYSLVKSGDWTWDKFFELCSAASGPDAVYSWGSSSLGDAVYESAFVSCGFNMVNSGIMKIPSSAINADDCAAGASVLQRLGTDEKAVHANENAKAIFSEGGGYFLIEKLSEMQELKSSSSAWGILPMPKSEKADVYTELCGTDSLMFSCPSTVSTPEKSAILLMALNAASYGVIRDAYIGFIQFNFLRDNESANMLEYIIDGMNYDFAYTYGGIYNGVAVGTYYMLRDAAITGEDFGVLINSRTPSAESVFQSRFDLTN